MRCAAIVLALAGCHAARPAATISDGERLFWDVFGSQQHARIPEAIAALEAETRAHPQAARPYLLIGTAHVWRIAEADLAGLRDPRAEAEAAVAALERYRALAPGDPRVATWLTPVMLGQANGLRGAAEHVPPGPQQDAMIGQADGIERDANRILDEAVAREPRFNLFGRMLIEAEAPDGSERLRRALDDVAELHRVRLGGALDLSSKSACDPARPPPLPFAASSDETTYRRDARCWNSWKTPFAYEGFWLFSGDVARRAGDAKGARAMYENARKLPSYSRWPYAFLVEERLARADAPFVFRAPNQCIICHARAGQPPFKGSN